MVFPKCSIGVVGKHLKVVGQFSSKAVAHDLQAIRGPVLVALAHQEVHVRLGQLHVAPHCPQVPCRPLHPDPNDVRRVSHTLCCRTIEELHRKAELSTQGLCSERTNGIELRLKGWESN